MIQKPKILFVPAWYPSTFFYEQFHLIEPDFKFRILKGLVLKFGKKRALKNLFRNKTSRVDLQNETINGDIVSNINTFFIKSLPKRLQQKEYENLSKIIESVLDQQFVQWKPDLIHIQSISDIAIFVCNWAKKNKIPVLLTEHILFVRREFDHLSIQREQLYEKVDKVLCVSNYVYRNLLTNSFQMRDVGVIGNYVNDKYVSNTLNKNDLNSKKILFVASHLADKDIHILFDALVLLKETKFEYHVDIVGLDRNKKYLINEEQGIKLQEKIDELYLTKQVELKGEWDRKELLQSYKNYSVLVSSSFSETFGLGIAEAIASGLPVIITDNGGSNDFVNAENGITVPIRNSYVLAHSIISLLDNYNQYNRQKSAQIISNTYGQRAFFERINGEYKSLIQKR